MKRLFLTIPLALSLLSTPLVAQESEPFDVKAAMKKIAELLKKSESALVESIGSKPADAATGEKARDAIDKLIGQSRTSGQEIVRQINEILINSPP